MDFVGFSEFFVTLLDLFFYIFCCYNRTMPLCIFFSTVFKFKGKSYTGGEKPMLLSRLEQPRKLKKI